MYLVTKQSCVRICMGPFSKSLSHMGGFPTLRYNELRDMTASLLTEVCSNVATEPHLQPLSGEVCFRYQG